MNAYEMPTTCFVKKHMYNDKIICYRGCSCSDEGKVLFSIEHDKQPIELKDKVIMSIENLLWYAPNIDGSAQSSKENKYLQDVDFNNALVTFFLRFLGLTKEDIFETPFPSLPDSYVEDFTGSVCTTCHKVLVTVRNKNGWRESTIEAILRHMRNCLAHGRFNMINEKTILGIDEVPNTHSTTAILKLNIECLYDFTEAIKISSENTISQLFQYAMFLKSYHVICPYVVPINNPVLDRDTDEFIFAWRDDQQYVLAINYVAYKESNEEANRYSLNTTEISFIKELFPDRQVILLFYRETEEYEIRSVDGGEDKYFVSTKLLKTLVGGNDITKHIPNLLKI